MFNWSIVEFRGESQLFIHSETKTHTSSHPSRLIALVTLDQWLKDNGGPNYDLGGTAEYN